MIPILAWRNLWRNRTRSLITMASVFFAVLLATTMSSLQAGSYELMIANMAGRYTGYIQIHKRGYWDDRVLDNAFRPGEALTAKARSVNGVQALVPRLEDFVLASTGDKTSGAMVAGIDPAAENELTGLAGRVSQGGYLRPNDSGLLVAEGLARKLGLRPGDSLVLLGQGYHGASAAGRFPVRGEVHFGSPDLNERMVYLPLPAAQAFFGAQGLLTAYVVSPRPGKDPIALASAIRKSLGTEFDGDYEVMAWDDMLPDLKQAIAADRGGALIMLGVLYLIISFGIFGTLLMMTYERRREFGVLLSIGMRRRRLALMLFLESLLLGGLGVLAGLAGSFPVVWWLTVHPLRFSGRVAEAYARFGLEPIFPATTRLSVFVQQGLWVWGVTLVIALVPVWRAYRIGPLEAMRK